MSKIYQAPKGKGTGVTSLVLGIGVSGLLFLAIPLTQIFNKYEKQPEEIMALEVAPPPPPPPPEEPPPPPEPEKEEPPPELDTPPPPISLEQLDMALNPGTGSLVGDYALPTVDVSSQELGGVEIFDIMDADKKPLPRKQVEPRVRGEKGSIVLRFTVDQYGKVQNIRVHQSTNPKLNQPSIEAVRRWEFSPGEKDGRTIITNNVQLPINFN